MLHLGKVSRRVKIEKPYLRSWRNWQTRTVQVRVGDHGGSNPLDRTIKNRYLLDACFFIYKKTGFEPHGLHQVNNEISTKKAPRSLGVFLFFA